ncbi:MAG: threonine synthase [Dehalococcoidia bacterium]|nr:threonine synthase [Dehalococcoidia bacterium]
MKPSLLQRYREFLPITDQTPMITMGEGGTPLVKAERIGRDIGASDVYFKMEGCNPTGSFKDRGMVMAIAKALEAGSRFIACASTGNTSASAAAYGAHCGLTTLVLVPKGNIAAGKMAQAIAYGAHVLTVNGNFDRALQLVRELCERYPINLVNSVNPFRLEGQKTAAFEVVDDLGEAPDFLCIPVGNAGNITAYWRGFREYREAGRSSRLPKMMGFQAEGAAPIVAGHPIADPKTIASAIRIGNPASWKGAVAARDESGGRIDAVTDEEILEAYKMLARTEGVFCEPASAASVAGLRKLAREGMDFRGKRVVCVITGSGLKDPDLAQQIADVPLQEVSPNLESIEEAVSTLLRR